MTKHAPLCESEEQEKLARTKERIKNLLEEFQLCRNDSRRCSVIISALRTELSVYDNRTQARKQRELALMKTWELQS